MPADQAVPLKIIPITRFFCAIGIFVLKILDRRYIISFIISRRLISFLYTYLSAAAKYTTPISSASGNEYHTRSRPAMYENIHAIGSIPMSCLSSDPHRLRKPCPIAWNID